MSETLTRKRAAGLPVEAVEPGSPAARAGIRVGDRITAVAGGPVHDVLDYRFRSADGAHRVTLVRDDCERTVTVRSAAGDDPGIVFSEDLADRVHTCDNRCMFCFIHQMPKRMRRSLYLMDDDYRLSFMHGNYITLTNVSEEEFARIVEQRLSPLYVSVHATDPELRGRLLGRRGPEPILPRLRALAEGRIDVHAQIVLCPGVNDGDQLARTLAELSDLHPAVSERRSGVLSTAIVPVGLTRNRDRLTRLSSADGAHAVATIEQVNALARGYRRRLGTRFVWLSDEWFFLAGRTVPGRRHYEDFPQLEDGVGTVRLFLDDARALQRRLPARADHAVRATLVTAELAGGVVCGLAERLNAVEGVDLNVCIVPNRFFGGGINIAGLLTAQDVQASLAGFPTLDVVCLPSICLRDGELFLDDVTLVDFERELGRPVRVVGIRPSDLAAALGIAAPARRGGPRASRWRMEAPPGDA